jgi:aryl-alcohol dehydrogenase-like predicted oxidoreductase
MKLALGTVQFGMDYGIANRDGKVKNSEIKKILNTSKLAGINTLDTAISYGNSEDLLGKLGVKNWKVITKLPQVPEDCRDIKAWIRKNIFSSLKKLNTKTVEGLLLHRSGDLIENKAALWNELKYFQKEGLIKNIGYSIYSPSELDSLFEEFKPDLIQAPYNIFDRRLKNTGWLDKLKENNVEVHARSCFLQGLLLMKPHMRPKKFKNWAKLFYLYDNWLKDTQQTPLEACLKFVDKEKAISKIVVGIDNNNQLNDILQAITINTSQGAPFNIYSNDEGLINPANWDLL